MVETIAIRISICAFRMLFYALLGPVQQWNFPYRRYGMKKNQHQEIVLKAISFAKTNLDKPVSVPDLVRHTGFSRRHIYYAFREILNQSVAEFILSTRLERAQDLLKRTQLEITQIALESGFDSYSHFAKAFRRRMQMTPSQFREQVSQLDEMPMADTAGARAEKKQEWFCDSFRGEYLSSAWALSLGEWHQANGTLLGTGKSNSISFLKPLPENFRISFQVRAQTNPNSFNSVFSLSLLDEPRQTSYCDCTFALSGGYSGRLIIARTGQYWIPGARMREGQWHSIALELNEDRIRLFLDDSEVFTLRDSFPPAYSCRCALNILGWHCRIELRDFAVQNLGFRPVVRPVRQGDALYNSGLPNKAMEFFLRYLQAGSATDPEIMELRYKIAMCCLRNGAFTQARAWLDKVVFLQSDRFWADQARLALAELHWKAGDVDGLLEQFDLCLRDPNLGQQGRVLLELSVHDFLARGFSPEAERTLRLWRSIESPGSFSWQVAVRDLSDCLQKMNDFCGAEILLNDLLRNSTLNELLTYARIDRMQLYHEWGKFEESESCRREMEADTKDPYILARCTMVRALNLRAKDRFEEALEALEKMPELDTTEFLGHAQVHRALILCCMRRLQEGHAALDRVRIVDPNRALRSSHFLPFHLCEKNYAAAAEALLADYRESRDFVSHRAELGVKAGILHALAGNAEEARSIYKEVSQRFPDQQVRYFGQLANALLAHEDFDFAQMPYEHFRRSEVFHLIGLLMEKRGDNAAARALFELSVKDDPALRWPAYFSKKKLSELTFTKK